MTIGTCKYCGEKAGLLTNKHKQCELLHKDGLYDAEELFFSFLCKPISSNDFTGKVKQMQAVNFLSDEDKTECAVKALKRFTEAIRRPYTHAIEQNVKQLFNLLIISPDAVNKDRTLNKLAQKVVKGYLVAYFTDGASETQV